MKRNRWRITDRAVNAFRELHSSVEKLMAFLKNVGKTSVRKWRLLKIIVAAHHFEFIFSSE